METSALCLTTTPPSRTLRRDLALVLGGVALLTISARISLPIGAVPISAQTLGVLLLGAMLGARRSAASVLGYLTAGAAGLPVFVGGGGLPYLLGPTGGYLWGFLPAAWLAGEFAGRGWMQSPTRCLPALILADALLFAFGLAWLALYVPPRAILAAGLWPILPGEVLKITIAATLLTRRR